MLWEDPRDGAGPHLKSLHVEGATCASSYTAQPWGLGVKGSRKGCGWRGMTGGPPCNYCGHLMGWGCLRGPAWAQHTNDIRALELRSRALSVLVSLILTNQCRKQKCPVLGLGEETGGPDQLVSGSHQALPQPLSRLPAGAMLSTSIQGPPGPTSHTAVLVQISRLWAFL